MSSLVKANLKYRKFGQYVTTQDEVEEEMLKGLILNLRHVKDLKIGGECLEAVTRLKAKGFDFPSNIKFPESECESGSEIESKSDTNSVEGGD